MTFQEWITKKYLEWRGDRVGRGSGTTHFARWLTVSHALVSQWINDGAKPESSKIINKLVAKYGAEVYDVLKLTRPPDLDAMTDDELIDYVMQRLGPNWDVVYRAPQDTQRGKS